MQEQARSSTPASLLSWTTQLGRLISGRVDSHLPPCTDSLWPNIVCTLSNWCFTGIPALLLNWHLPYRRGIILRALIASTIYHLSEVKGRLPGLPYLRHYAFWLLQLDRLCAIHGGWEIFQTLVFAGGGGPFALPPWYAIVIAVAGIVCNFISESTTHWHFVGWHSLWHNAAFVMFIIV